MITHDCSSRMNSEVDRNIWSSFPHLHKQSQKDVWQEELEIKLSTPLLEDNQYALNSALREMHQTRNKHLKEAAVKVQCIEITVDL